MPRTTTDPKRADAVMFIRMLTAAPVLPAHVHRTAWRTAQRTGDTALSKTLMARLDAPADLVREYANVTSTELRGVYLARPQGDHAELAANLAGETRASVLADALTRSQMHPAVVAVARSAYLARPTKALTGHMLAVARTEPDPDLTVALLTTLDTEPTASQIHFGRYELLYGMPRGRVLALLGTLTHPKIVGPLAATTVGADDVVAAAAAKAVKRILSEPVPAGTFGGLNLWQASSVLITLSVRGRTNPGRVLDAIEDVTAPHGGEVAQRTRDSVKRERQTAPQPAVVIPAPTPAAPATTDLTHASARDLAQLATSTDPAVVAAVASRVVTDGAGTHQHEPVVAHLLVNPTLSPADRYDVLEAVRTAHDALGLSLIDVITLFPDDEHARAVWCQAFPFAVLQRHGWEPFGGASAVTVDLLMSLWEGAQGVVMFEQALAAGFDVTLLLDLPTPMSARLWDGMIGQRAENAGPAMLARTTEMIADRLGDSPAAWDTFLRLRSDFTGTLGELLEVSTATAA